MKRALVPLLLSLACATRVVPPSTRGTRRVPRIARTATAAPAPSRLLLQGGTTRRLEVLPRENDVRRVVLEGRPVELREGQPPRFGRGRLLRAVTFAAPAAGGRWRFITDDGLWESDGFLGDLRLVAAVGSGAPGLGVGRAVTVQDGVVAGLRSPDEGMVIDAAFVDDSIGLAVTEPGLAWSTRDGGAHWSRVTAEGVALSVVASRDTHWLRTTHGTWSIDAQGAASATVDRLVPSIAELEWRDLSTLSDEHRDVLDRLEPVALASTDGSVMLAGRGRATGLYDLRDESWSPLPELPAGCALTVQWFFAGRLHAWCERDLHVLGSDGHWSMRLRVAPCGGSVAACFGSADGARVLCPGRCSADAECVTSDVWCESVAGAPPREHRADDTLTAWRPIGYAGHALIGVERRSFLDRTRVTIGDGAPRLLVGDAPEGLLRVDPASVVLGPDGWVRMNAWVAGENRVGVLEGPPGGRFAWRAPPGTEPVDLSLLGDQVTVTARGGESTAILVSRGPGSPWAPLQADPDDPLAAPFLGSALTVWNGPHDSGYSPNAIVLLGGGGPVRIAATSGLSALPGPPHAAITPEWRCDVVSETAWSDPRQRFPDQFLMPWVGVQRGRRVALFDDDNSDLTTSPFPVAELASGTDLAFSAESRRQDTWALATHEPTRATLLRIAPDAETVVETWAIGASPSSRPIASLRVPATSRWANVRAVARSAERAAVLFSLTDATTSQSSTPWIADLRRDGALTVARISGAEGAFVLDDTAGFARVRADGRVVGGPAGASPRVLAERVTTAPCPATARGDVRLDAVVSIEGGTGRETETGTGRYALDGDSLCLRSIVSRAPGGWVIAREGAGWGARSSSRGDLIAHRCTALAPPGSRGRRSTP